MDWKLFIQLIATFLIAALGWCVAHYFTTRRDLANERRKLRIAYLLEAYRKLENASNREPINWPLFESAIADIQLLGSTHQVSLARQFAIAMGKNGTASLDELIFDLRQSLRSELELEPVSEKVVYMRFVDRS